MDSRLTAHEGAIPSRGFKYDGGGSSRLQNQGGDMSLGTIVLVILILMLVGVLPTWPHSQSWGPWPAGGIGLVVLILVILLVLGKI